MDRDEVWRTIDEQRSRAGRPDGDASPTSEWETPSLCEGWRVRDVAAHLTLATMRLRPGARRDASGRAAASTG